MFACLSTADLSSAGWSNHLIFRATNCCLRRLRRGVFVVTKACTHPAHGFIADIASAEGTDLPKETEGMRKQNEDLRILVRSYVGHLPEDAVFSHRSALVIHGLPIPYFDRSLQVVAETVCPRYGVRTTDMVVKRRTLTSDSILSPGGVRVTSVAQTLFDIARDCPLAFAVACVDEAVRRSAITLEAFSTHCRAHPVRTGQRKIAAVLENVDGRRETVAESVCAVRFVEHSIHGFEPQFVVLDSRGNFLARTDFGNETAKVIAEFDGAGKYYLDDDDPHRAFEQERQREYRLRNEGYSVFRIRWPDLFRADVFLRIKEAVEKRSAALVQA